MNQRLSDFLNAGRWIASLLVVLSHTRHLLFVDLKDVVNPSLAWKGFYFLTGFGDEAVVAFFVISGFLVGGLSSEKIMSGQRHLSGYFVDRFSRIYVVLFPALLVGGALDLIGANFLNTSELYSNAPKYGSSALGWIVDTRLNLEHFLGSLFMLQNVFTLPFGSNGPLWSLSFEWWYYMAFAAVCGTTQSTTTSRKLISALSLSSMLFLLPGKIVLFGTLWLVGAGAYHWIRKGLPVPPFWLGIALLAATLTYARLGHNINNLTDQESLSSAFSRSLLVAIGFGLATLSASKGTHLPFSQLSKWLANFSYSTYLFHFPALVFLIAAGMEMGLPMLNNKPSAGALLLFTCLLFLTYTWCYAASRLTEAHTERVRNMLRTFWLSTKLAR